MSSMTDPPPPVDSIDAVIDRQWAALGSPGTWMGGPERLALADIARTPPGVADSPDGADDPAVSAAMMVAHHPARLTAEHVDRFEASGLRHEQYVEVVGLVSRVLAIDTFDRGLDRTPRKLPSPTAGEPSRSQVPDAKQRAGWVPTVGAISPPTALSSVTSEATAQEDLHAALYLAYSDMGDLTAVRELTRAQMELVAARTSFVNDCFF
jgi:alkylhydroperoxidase family enzyme